ncbi:MAG: DUF423 domain-containing protein [Gemmatimonadales bacterium]
MSRLFLILGSLFGFISVAAGAFGAHRLRASLSAESLAIFETAARYQMYHALALIAVAWIAGRGTATLPAWAGWLFVGGIIVFCGSLYLLALTGVRWLGAVTPLGGVAFLAGWLCLAAAAWRMPG